MPRPSLSRSLQLFRDGLDKLLWVYWLAFKEKAWEIFWGPTLLGVAFGIYTLWHSPALPWFLTYVLIVVFLTGYYLWRVNYVRLMPKLSVTTLCPPNETDTENPDVTNLYIQLTPECLTDAPVHGCRGRLLQVSKRLEENDEWRLTSMDSPLFLDWDYYGSCEFKVEPGIKQRLNVCWWSNRSRLIIPAVNPLPSKFRNIFNDFESFRFDIRFTATDCEPVDVAVVVSLRNRQWNKPNTLLIQGHEGAGKK